MEYLIFIGCIIALVVISRIISLPFKIIFKLLFNVFLGVILILLINTFGAGVNLHIPFNFVTAAVIGFLGIPGVILLTIFRFII